MPDILPPPSGQDIPRGSNRVRNNIQPACNISGGLPAAFAVASGLRPLNGLQAQIRQHDTVEINGIDLTDELERLKTIQGLYQLLQLRCPHRLQNEPPWQITDSSEIVLGWLMDRWTEELGDAWDFGYNFKSRRFQVNAYREYDIEDNTRFFAFFWLPHAEKHFPEFFRMMIGVAGCIHKIYGLEDWKGQYEEGTVEYFKEMVVEEEDADTRAKYAELSLYYSTAEPDIWYHRMLKAAMDPLAALKAIESFSGKYPRKDFREVVDAAYILIQCWDGKRMVDFDCWGREDEYNDAEPIMVHELNRYAWNFSDDVWSELEERMNHIHSEWGSAPWIERFPIDKERPHTVPEYSIIPTLLCDYLTAGYNASCEYYRAFPKSRSKFDTQ